MAILPHHVTTGIDISDRKLRLVRLQRRYNALTMLAFAELDLPDGIVANGLIMQPEQFVAALKELPKQAVGSHWGTHNVHVGLPEQLSFITAAPIENGDKELPVDLVKKAVPLAEAEMYYDTTILRSTKTIALVAARKDAIHRLLEQFAKANYDVVGIHPESEAICHAVLPYPLAKAPATILVDLGTARTTIAVWARGAVYFTVSYPTVIQAGGSIMDAQLRGAIQQTSQYILEHFGHIGSIAQYMICGSGSAIGGIDQWLQQVVQLPVQLGNPLLHLKGNHVSKKLTLPASFATAIGLALAN